MRIISGQFGGRPINPPRTKAIRPTSDKIRGAMMNAIESRGGISNAYVLDGFCGTGALGLEALSRGAEHITFIDQNQTSLELAQSNVDLLGVQADSTLMLKDMTRLGALPSDHKPKDLVLMDPPYAQDLMYDALESLLSGGWLADECLLVIEDDKNEALDVPERFEILSEKLYGDTKVVLLQLGPPTEDEA